MSTDEDLRRHAAANLAQADALLFGRVTYEMMEAAWRPLARTGVRPDWMADWMEPFARTIDAAKEYAVSSTLDRVDWNAELVRGDPGKAVQQLKREPGKGLFVGGVKLPQALAELGLIDEYELIVQPRLAGHGPTLFAGLSKRVDLKLVSRLEFSSGAVAMRYEPRYRRLGPHDVQGVRAERRAPSRSRLRSSTLRPPRRHASRPWQPDGDSGRRRDTPALPTTQGKA
jgi:dihydrofolate reductase